MSNTIYFVDDETAKALATVDQSERSLASASITADGVLKLEFVVHDEPPPWVEGRDDDL